jgi:hypothetical protein
MQVQHPFTVYNNEELLKLMKIPLIKKKIASILIKRNDFGLMNPESEMKGLLENVEPKMDNEGCPSYELVDEDNNIWYYSFSINNEEDMNDKFKLYNNIIYYAAYTI